MHSNYLAAKPKEKNNLGDLSVDGRMILKWILKERIVRMWPGFNSLSNKLLVSKIAGYFLIG
jgi:hypothetical protein